MRQRYSLEIHQNSNGGILRITMVPTWNTNKNAMNLLIVALGTITGIFTLARYVQLSNTGQLFSIATIFFLLSLIFRRPTMETLTVLANYGVQIRKVRGLAFLPRSFNRHWFAETEFIPRDQVVDVVINEGFVRGFQVIFYLAVLVKESTKLRLLFAVCKHVFSLTTRALY